MNTLAHLYLAELTGTSPAGQILGDMIKGRLNGRFDPFVETGIRLHRRIDGFTDSHVICTELRRNFRPPYRRYAGILLDIGFDYCLARQWAQYDSQPLGSFAADIVARVQREWPHNAPVAAADLNGMAGAIAAYRQAEGLQRALNSVSRRLKRDNPLADALPILMANETGMTDGFKRFFPALCAYVHTQAQQLSASRP